MEGGRGGRGKRGNDGWMNENEERVEAYMNGLATTKTPWANLMPVSNNHVMQRM